MAKPNWSGLLMNDPGALHLASPSGGLPSAVRWSQLLLEDRLKHGDIVVDATLGNGHDTLFLAQQVLPNGRVFGFDVQMDAIVSTRRRLLDHQIEPQGFELFHAGHENLAEHLAADLRGKIDAVMFNLGYLPGSDKTLITRTATTLKAVQNALDWLAPSGLLTVVVYPGHDGGADEAREIAAWGAALSPRKYEVQNLRPVNRAAAPPECWAFWKRPDH